MSEPGPAAPVAGRLLELTVTDLALLERVRIVFADGLNVVTGETGAGKSLLIDALGLALGARADPGLVRHEAETARVEALFDRLPEPLVCVREVAASGRSVARIDDETVTAARLAATAGPLVEIHGQHEQARLLDERWQRDLLDAFGGHEAERAAMAAAVGAWRENEAARAALAVEPRELERRIALVEHEASEIAAARIRPGEVAEIRARLAASRHGEAIARGAATIVDLLAGDDGEARRPGRARAGGAGGGRGRGPRSARRPVRAPRGSACRARRRDRGRRLRDAGDGGRGGARRGRARGPGGAALLPLLPGAQVRDRLRGTPRARRAGRRRGRTAAGARRRAGPPGGRRDAPAGGRCRRGGSALERGAWRPPRTSAPGSSGASATSASAGPGWRSRWGAARQGARSRPSRSAGMPWHSTPRASTSSSSGSPRTPASRPARWRRSRRAASCPASPSPSRRSSSTPTPRRPWSSTRSTRGSAAGAPTRSGGPCGSSEAATRCCASPTCPRSPPMRTPTSPSTRCSAAGGR